MPAMGSAVTKNWEVEAGGAKHVVQLRHHTFSGRREVLVDGEVVWEALKFLDDGDEIPVRVGGRDGTIYISVDSVDFEYALVFDGAEVRDMVATVREHRDHDVDVSVPRVEVRKPAGDEPQRDTLVVYRLEVRLGERRLGLWKRFSDFCELDARVRSAFAGNHLLANLPRMPARSIKWFVDHSAPDFVEARRQRLEEYIRRLVVVPKVMDLPDVQLFFRPRPKRAAAPGLAAAEATPGAAEEERKE